MVWRAGGDWPRGDQLLSKSAYKVLLWQFRATSSSLLLPRSCTKSGSLEVELKIGHGLPTFDTSTCVEIAEVFAGDVFWQLTLKV